MDKEKIKKQFDEWRKKSGGGRTDLEYFNNQIWPKVERGIEMAVRRGVTITTREDSDHCVLLGDKGPWSVKSDLMNSEVFGTYCKNYPLVNKMQICHLMGHLPGEEGPILIYLPPESRKTGRLLEKMAKKERFNISWV